MPYDHLLSQSRRPSPQAYDKPEAKAFQDWVTGTVLPGIRKDGGYIKGEEKVATGDMSEVLPSIREAPGTFHPTSVKPRDRL